MFKVTCFAILLCLYEEVNLLKLPGPRVFVVTPSPRPATNAGRTVSSEPFYYHNWMRRMDSPEQNTTTTTLAPNVETPDLIFAEFEKGNTMKKSIKSLLEKETFKLSTAKPALEVKAPNYGIPFPLKDQDKQDENRGDVPDYFAMYNNDLNSKPAPVYLPTTTPSTSRYTTFKPTMRTTTTTESPPAPQRSGNIENIWHIIDSEKTNQYDGKWNEVPIQTNTNEDVNSETEQSREPQDDEKNRENDSPFDENFALPGFHTDPGNGAENESRAIRTEPNMRFPYVNLKPFLMKNSMKPMISNKKGNNMLNLDTLRDVKHPVRGETQDLIPDRQSIDRYNPAQPYLPSEYGSKSKQSNIISQPTKNVANLIPPPPPPANGDDFPAPTNYDSFPPYSPPNTDSAPAPPPPPVKPPIQFPDTSDSSDSSPDSYDAPPIELGYRYKPPSPSLPFVPTLPPVNKPFKGYSYSKPAPKMPAMPNDSDFGGYQYSKPEPPAPNGRPSYGPQQDAPSYQPDYPELIYDKPHQGDDSKGNDMGMMPPPPPDMKPDMSGPPSSDDHGFPNDFPGDFKYHHDFDDHDFYHHHHHHPTTTTSTTETPRVNRFSYYYLGKKLYYLPLYFSVYFIVYVGALIIKAVLRHKIVYPNSWRPNDQTAGFFTKRSVDSWDLSNERLHEITGRVTHSIAEAAKKYLVSKKDT